MGDSACISVVSRPDRFIALVATIGIDKEMLFQEYHSNYYINLK